MRYAATVGVAHRGRLHGRRRAAAHPYAAADHAGQPGRRPLMNARFDELIHAPTRLSIVSLLAATEWAEFKFIRDSIELSDSALSKQLTILEEAGYVEIRKGFVGKRPRTSARLSRAGRAAFEQHVAALQEIVARSGARSSRPRRTDRGGGVEAPRGRARQSPRAFLITQFLIRKRAPCRTSRSTTRCGRSTGCWRRSPASTSSPSASSGSSRPAGRPGSTGARRSPSGCGPTSRSRWPRSWPGRSSCSPC